MNKQIKESEKLTEQLNVRITESERRLMNYTIKEFYPGMKAGTFMRMVLHLHWRKIAVGIEESDKLDQQIAKFLKSK